MDLVKFLCDSMFQKAGGYRCVNLRPKLDSLWFVLARTCCETACNEMRKRMHLCCETAYSFWAGCGNACSYWDWFWDWLETLKSSHTGPESESVLTAIRLRVILPPFINALTETKFCSECTVLDCLHEYVVPRSGLIQTVYDHVLQLAYAKVLLATISFGT